MSAVVWQAVMILSSYVLLDSSVQGCSPGWFGQHCDFQCNCNVSLSCGSQGDCPPNERCKLGFFGPGCQYVDLAARSSGASSPPYLFDNDETSCNPDSQATSVLYALTHGTPVSWFRIYSRYNPRQYSFHVKINGFGPYDDERQYLVNQHVVDVMWGEVYEIKDITIVGNIAPTICSIQITTEHRDKTAGFNLRTIGPQGNVMVNYTDQTGYRIMTYYVLLKPFLPVVSIEMRSRQAHPREITSLEFCEIQVFGDTDCPPNTYGLECQESCLCGSNHRCSHVTGLCASRCPPGKYGHHCNTACSTYCRDGICHEQTGSCFECHPGFHGPLCNLPCNPGTYGSGCIHTCSPTCAHICDTANGYCGECVKGYHGQVCQHPCPLGCHEQICQRDTGECVACSTGHTGRYCSECPPGTYGVMCHMKCSPQCLNKRCASGNGTCANCTEGYTGSHCRTAPSTTSAADNYVMGMVVLVIMFGVIVPLLLIFCLERDIALKPDGEEESKQSLPVEAVDGIQSYSSKQA